MNQTSSTNPGPGVFRWADAASGTNNWYAYCPTIGQAAAKYGVLGESWTVVMNQANENNQGYYVYRGYFDTPGTEALLYKQCLYRWMGVLWLACVLGQHGL